MCSNSCERPIIHNKSGNSGSTSLKDNSLPSNSKCIALDSEELDSTSRTHHEEGSKDNRYQKVYEKHTSKSRDDKGISIHETYKGSDLTFGKMTYFGYISSLVFSTLANVYLPIGNVWKNQTFRPAATQPLSSEKNSNMEHIKYLETIIFNLRGDLEKYKHQNRVLKDENKILKRELSKAGITNRIFGVRHTVSPVCSLSF